MKEFLEGIAAYPCAALGFAIFAMYLMWMLADIAEHFFEAQRYKFECEETKDNCQEAPSDNLKKISALDVGVAEEKERINKLSWEFINLVKPGKKYYVITRGYDRVLREPTPENVMYNLREANKNGYDRALEVAYCYCLRANLLKTDKEKGDFKVAIMEKRDDVEY